MPKEHAHPGGVAALSNSKNAKEKSNSATLRACQGGAHRGGSAGGDASKRFLNRDMERDSEKDSGYSEAGSDDQRSSKSQPRRGSSKPSNNNNNNNMAPHEELTPIYVFKNLLVKPSGPECLHPPLSWAGGWQSLGAGKPPPQVILIQQPAMPAPPSSSPAPPACLAPPPGKKAGGCSGRSSYLPILNSYPRIAPHPRKESGEVKGSVWGGGVKESEGQSQSKRVCTEEEKREAGGGHSSPSISSSSSSSSSPPRGPHRPDSGSTRQRRFLNTAEILSQSGLLAITLRTKELLRQSAATERQLMQLRQHTQALCSLAQAAAPPANLHRLFQDMDDSGCYPDLDLDHRRALGGSQRAGGGGARMGAVSLYGMDDGTSPPSPLFAPSPEPVSTSFPDSLLEFGLAVRDEMGGSPGMFPESSTHSYLL